MPEPEFRPAVNVGVVSIDATSLERAGTDSISADTNAKNTASGLQKTVTGQDGNVNSVAAASLGGLFALDVLAKLFAIDNTTGNLRALLTDDTGALITSAVLDAVSVERGGSDSITSDVNGRDDLGTGNQVPVSVVPCNTSIIQLASRANLVGLYTIGKLMGETPAGDLSVIRMAPDGYVSEPLFIEAAGTITIDGDAGGAPVTVEEGFDFSTITYLGKIKRILLVRTAVAGTPFTASSLSAQFSDIASAADEGINSLYREDAMEPNSNGMAINKTDVNFGEIMYSSKSVPIDGKVYVRIGRSGGDGTSSEEYKVLIQGERALSGLSGR